MPGPVFRNVLDSIGNTPLIEVARIDTGPCRLFLKLENQNPGGSIKDRIGLSMIAAAERDGSLAPGGAIIEATAGNTGLGLALVAAQKGYRLTIVVPDKMAQEKIFPCLSGLHPHPLGLEWAQTGYRGARHGCSRPRRSPIPAFATRVPATFPR